jgi:hypothetical protein
MPPDLPPGFDDESLRRLMKQMADAADRMRQVVTPELRESINRMSQIALPPGLLESMKRLNDQMLDQTQAMQRMVGSTLAPAIEKWSLQLPKIDVSWIEQIRPILEDARRAFVEALPPNWQNIPFDDLRVVLQLVEETGYCLVWLPREEIVREVIAADSTDIASVLLGRRNDVLDDAVALLSEVTAAEYTLEREAALAAISAFREGHAEAAQALASSVFTSTLHNAFATGRTKVIRKLMLETHPDDARIQELRLRTIYLAGAHALSEFRPDRAWPVRREFNRHNTAHRITAEQWTEANALSAIMLSTALLRELQFWSEQESLGSE